MEKEFVPYDIALAMKQLGFNEPCLAYYTSPNELILQQPKGKNSEFVYYAPLFQQAYRWFKEEYGITSWIEEDKHGFSYNLRGADFTQTIKDTYEEAELACLRKLIEIVKENL